ncbi:hypothetical protein TNCT_268391 [Trichonephila clavata]|uniref:Uncharacterized protein n=1 Tax=Trichonephila clavata TaxID=2740835 RepID=A0A8X6LFA5_TRICU|nr:hypothetical protein TNCT_268391 [Trichonephila clavata]
MDSSSIRLLSALSMSCLSWRPEKVKRYFLEVNHFLARNIASSTPFEDHSSSLRRLLWGRLLQFRGKVLMANSSLTAPGTSLGDD